MPVSFIVIGTLLICLLLNNEYRILKFKNFLFLSALIFLSVGYFVGNVYLSFVSFNIFQLTGLCLLLCYLLRQGNLLRSFILVLIFSIVYILLLSCNEPLLVFYTYDLLSLSVLLVSLLSSKNIKDLFFTSILSSIVFMIIDLYFELNIFDYYEISFVNIFDVVLGVAMSVLILYELKKILSVWRGNAKICFNNSSNVNLFFFYK